jgi:hypothetical protein
MFGHVSACLTPFLVVAIFCNFLQILTIFSYVNHFGAFTAMFSNFQPFPTIFGQIPTIFSHLAHVNLFWAIFSPSSAILGHFQAFWAI